MCQSKRMQNPPQTLARRLSNPPTRPLDPKALLPPRRREVPSAHSSSWVAVLEGWEPASARACPWGVWAWMPCAALGSCCKSFGLGLPKVLSHKDSPWVWLRGRGPNSRPWVWLQGRGRTHVHDEEVEPAPGVGEVHLEAVGHPLEQHLNDEDVGEDLVSVLQDGLDGGPLLNVDVLKGLGAPAQWVARALGAGAAATSPALPDSAGSQGTGTGAGLVASPGLPGPIRGEGFPRGRVPPGLWVADCPGCVPPTVWEGGSPGRPAVGLAPASAHARPPGRYLPGRYLPGLHC